MWALYECVGGKTCAQSLSAVQTYETLYMKEKGRELSSNVPSLSQQNLNALAGSAHALRADPA